MNGPVEVQLRPSTGGWSGGEDLLEVPAHVPPEPERRPSWWRRALGWAWAVVLRHLGAPR